MTKSDRIAAIQQVVNNPPQVHGRSAASGVWSSATDCYRFMADHVEPGSRTLETGLGSSTVLLAAWGADHTCVVHSQDEVDRCVDYLKQNDISMDTLAFKVGSSEAVLPNLEPGALDLYFIDGCHGYPLPIIDWFYGARWLRPGGVLVVDDVDLPQVKDYLSPFLDGDPRWTRLAKTRHWAAYQLKESIGVEEWRDQPFLGVPWTHRPAGLKVMTQLGKIKRRIRQGSSTT